jgi:hypothetical protein
MGLLYLYLTTEKEAGRAQGPGKKNLLVLPGIES